MGLVIGNWPVLPALNDYGGGELLDVSRALSSMSVVERRRAIAKLEEKDGRLLDQFWMLAQLLPVLKELPAGSDRNQSEMLLELNVIARIPEQLRALSNDPDKRVGQGARRLSNLIDDWEKMERGELERPLVGPLLDRVPVTSLGELAYLQRRTWWRRIKEFFGPY